ncbi:MAG: S-adenosylmethionine:tRNA ribosyltransferase-isomerase, partial [candidate division Zixibacteria bacterium]|nr:S-adenosylmethionine:tRNA ribosyltransferase-isomerase [candidate division Zixibacteria bacterium]
ARLRPGATVEFATGDGHGYEARIETAAENGTRTVQFIGAGRFDQWLARTGSMPLPPYIKRPARPQDRRDYQTVFAQEPGAVAAPTAGLHFDQVLLRQLRSRRIGVAALTLHVGAGTFRPIVTDEVEDHRLESERYRITGATQSRIRKRRHSGRGRIIAVGTTVARSLETVAQTGLWDMSSEDAGSSRRPPHRRFTTIAGRTELFIRPGHQFRAVDALITNFHLPRSSLLALVAAFAGAKGGNGLEMIQSTYQLAVREGYRFYSYGDAMLIA